MKPLIALFAVLTLFSACANFEYPPPDVLPADYTACDVPEDCVVVELGCCDACNGGEARSVAADQADAVRTRYTEPCREGQGCTEIGCAAWITTCEGGVCGLERGEF
jgi:hypothetical protein